MVHSSRVTVSPFFVNSMCVFSPSCQVVSWAPAQASCYFSPWLHVCICYIIQITHFQLEVASQQGQIQDFREGGFFFKTNLSASVCKHALLGRSEGIKWPLLRHILAGFKVLIQHEIPFIYLQNKCQKVINATWALTRLRHHAQCMHALQHIHWWAVPL